jgi:hypothetical protein
MFCRFCGSNLPDDSTFCRSCGKSIAAPATAPASTNGMVVGPTPTIRARQRGMLWFLLALLMLLICWGLVIVVNRSPSGPELRRTLSGPQPRTQMLTDTAFTLSAAQYQYIRFSVPKGATSVRVQGTFSASGGLGKDIEVYVLTEDAFVNWQNRHPVGALYTSGRITQGTLNVGLPSDAGSYDLVFSNTFSLLSPKAVQANVRLQYAL